MKRYVIILALLLFSSAIFSQAGMRFYAGLTAGVNEDKNVTTSGAHYGWTAGVDGRLNDGDLFFVVGLRLTEVSVNGTSFSVIPEDKLELGNFRLGLGYKFKRLGRKKYLRTKLIGEIDFVRKYAATAIQNPDYRSMNDAFAGITTGLGLDWGFLTFDLEFKKGIINSHFQKKEALFNFYSFSTGFFF